MCFSHLMMGVKTGISRVMQENLDGQWIRNGIDIWMIRDNLQLSYEDRVTQHQNTLNLIVALEHIRDQNRARPSITPEITHRQPR